MGNERSHSCTGLNFRFGEKMRVPFLLNANANDGEAEEAAWWASENAVWYAARYDYVFCACRVFFLIEGAGSSLLETILPGLQFWICCPHTVLTGPSRQFFCLGLQSPKDHFNNSNNNDRQLHATVR